MIDGEETFEKVMAKLDNAQIVTKLRRALPEHARNLDTAELATFLREVSVSNSEVSRNARRLYTYLLQKRYLSPEFIASYIKSVGPRPRLKLPSK